MDELVCKLEVMPAYGQVVVGDPHGGDVPQFETGEEAATSNTQLVVVACQSDFDGLVRCLVWKYAGVPAWKDDVVFAGELCLTTPDLFVGSLLTGDGATIEVGRGWHGFVIRAQPVGAASQVDIAVCPPRHDDDVG